LLISKQPKKQEQLINKINNPHDGCDKELHIGFSLKAVDVHLEHFIFFDLIAFKVLAYKIRICETRKSFL